MDRIENHERSAELALIRRLAGGEAGAWEEFVGRYSDLIYSLCGLVFSGGELEREYLNVLGRLESDRCALLRDFDGRATLHTYLQLRLGECLGFRVAALFKEDGRKAWIAFERLFKKEILRIIGRHFRRSRDDPRGGAREDLYQEICLGLVDQGYRRLASYDGRGSFGAYVRKIVQNLCMDLVRRWEGRKRLPEAVLRLAALEQEVYRQVAWHGRSEKELAQTLRDEAGNLYPPARIEKALAQVRRAVPKAELHAGRRPREVPLIGPGRDGEAKEHQIPDSRAAPEAVLAEAEEERAQAIMLSALKEAVAELPSEAQLYVRLRFYANPPRAPHEIARIMGRPEPEIYRIRQQAVSLLRAALKAKGVGEMESLSV